MLLESERLLLRGNLGNNFDVDYEFLFCLKYTVDNTQLIIVPFILNSQDCSD